jgi:hypothetical protein
MNLRNLTEEQIKNLTLYEFLNGAVKDLLQGKDITYSDLVSYDEIEDAKERCR